MRMSVIFCRRSYSQFINMFAIKCLKIMHSRIGTHAPHPGFQACSARRVSAFIAASLAGLSYYVLEQGRDLAQRADQVNQKAYLASEIRAASRAVQRDLLNMVLDPNAESRRGMAENVERRIKQMQDLSARFVPMLNEADRVILVNFDALREQVIQSFAAVRQQAMAGQADAAYKTFVQDVRACERAMSAVTDPFIAAMEKEAAEFSRAVQDQAVWAERISAIFSVLGISPGSRPRAGCHLPLGRAAAARHDGIDAQTRRSPMADRGAGNGPYG